MINKVTLIGNLTKDAEAVATNGKSMTRIRLATNSRWRNTDGVLQDSVEFHSLVAFGRTAETCALYCVRGIRVYVEGHLRTRQYDASDGTRRYSTEVVVDLIKMLSSRADDDSASRGDVEADVAAVQVPLAS